MPSPHPLPVPPEIIRRACEQVDLTVGRLPFRHGETGVDRDLVAAALEELNAEPSRMLALRHRLAGDGRVDVDGLDRHLALRGFPQEGAAAAVAGVLIRAGIAQKSSIADRRSRRMVQGIRLLPAWTWTVVTAGRRPSPKTAIPYGGDRAAEPWTDLCPVCRAGSLGTVTGQRLFGILETDFLACTSCGARFVEEAGRFRLAAIPKRQDPLQADLLNVSLAPDEWQAVARGGDVPAARRPGTRTAGKAGRKTGHPGDNRAEGGRLAVETGDRTLWFRHLPVHFSRGSTPDLFAQRREPLHEILRNPAYAGFAEQAAERYRHYLDVPAGPFLLGLKNRRDPSYLRFLNPYGDRNFCTFRTTDTGIAVQGGIFVVAKDGAVLAAGASSRPFGKTINEDLGSISPATCYLDGDAERCRVNALMCQNRKGGGGLYLHVLGAEEEISRILPEVAKACGL